MADAWGLRAALERCGSARPPAYAGLSPAAHLRTFDVSEGGGAALLSAGGRLHLSALFRPPAATAADASPTLPPTLAHVALDPPLTPSEAAAVELVQLNASASRVLLASRTWVKAVKLPSAARALLSSAEERTPSAARRRRGPEDEARYLVRLADGTERELAVAASAADAAAELERVRLALGGGPPGRARVASVSKQLGVAGVRPVGRFPGVRQAAWHPLSDAHVAVLSDAEELALFDLRADASRPEQRHLLDVPSGAGSGADSAQDAETTAFCFGDPAPLRPREPLRSPAGRWDPFTCFLLRSDGGVYALCPLVPFGCRVGRARLEALRSEVDAQIARCKKRLLAAGDRRQAADRALQGRVAELKSHKYWLQEAWGPVASRRRMAAPRASDDSDDALEDASDAAGTDLLRLLQPHESGVSPETWPLALQGPVDVTPSSVVAGKNRVAGGAAAASLLALPPFPRAGSSSRTSIPAAPLLVRSYTSGHVELVLLDAPVRPRWRSELRVEGGDALPALLLECLSLGIDDSGGRAVLAGDPTDPRLVYCLHSTGVHVLNVGWALSLATGKQFASLPKSSVRHIFSVSPSKASSSSSSSSSSSATVSNVIGARVAKSVDFGHLLLLRLASGSFEVVNVSAASTELLKGNALDGEGTSERAAAASAASKPRATGTAAATAAASELRPFADIVEEKLDVLNLRGTRVTGRTQLHEVDAAVLAFVVERVKILYEDVEYADAVEQLVRHRLLAHEGMAAAQSDKAAAVRAAVDAAKQALETLQRKMDKALAVQQNLAKRAAAVLQAVKENQPELSRAEREYKRELERLAIDARRLQPHVTQLAVSGQRLVRSLEAAGQRRSAAAAVATDASAALTDDKKRMCFDVLRAETQLIDDTKALVEELSAGLQQLRA